ncbi:MAG: hypothetical protein NZ528_02875 [Caldilineales bacterium]|nr:hypothetical protein [Caldilineales bacterium]MDW8319009.1 hypothetical protein [Anaerolineae bacterium]
MQEEIAARLDALAQEATRLVQNLETYWVTEGVSELGIFIDPDLFQYLDKLYRESRAFAERCQGLSALAQQLRNG